MTKCLDCKRSINTDVEEVIYDNNNKCICNDCWDIMVDEEHNNLSDEGGANVKQKVLYNDSKGN